LIRRGGVKPIRVRSPRIVHADERKSWVWVLLALALVGAALWQAFEYGKRQGGYDAAKVLAERMQLAREKGTLEKALNEARAESARYRRQAEIEREATRRLQQEMMAYQDRITELRAEVKMLKELISSGSGSLYLRGLRIEPLGEPGRYRYRFTLVQVRDDVELTRGKLVMKVTGRQGKKKKTLDRAQFAPDGEKAAKLEFRHYQDVEGEMVLPEGFEPRELRIEFLPRNKELKKLEATLPWPSADGDA